LQRNESLPSLKRLRAFDMVASTGSALTAAGRLRISQPAVTYSLDRLEAELGVALLDRRASGSFLTAQGRLFHNRTSRMFAHLLEALRDVMSAGGTADEKWDSIAWKVRETQIRALIAIWHSGGFRNAARDLGVTEPSLQRPARELERLLRVTLYRRTSIGLEVNSAGAQLARRLQLAFGEIWSGIEEIGAAHQSARANLRIGVLALSPRMMLAQSAGKLLAAHPQQRVEVIEGSYEQHAKALRTGGIDLIFGALRAPPPEDDLVEERLFEDPYVLVCRAGHPLASERSVKPADLKLYDFVLPTAGLPRRTVLDAMLARWKITPRAVVETSCLATIVALLRTSERISLLSRWHVGLDGWSGLRRLDAVAIEHEPRFVGFTSRGDWLPTPFQREFLDLMRESVGAWKIAS
jgi:LysR family transcriptional regulator of gallate degradation